MPTLLVPSRTRKTQMNRTVFLFNVAPCECPDKLKMANGGKCAGRCPNTLHHHYNDEEYVVPCGKKMNLVAEVVWLLLGDNTLRRDLADGGDPKEWDREVQRVRFRRTMNPHGPIDDFFTKYIQSGWIFSPQIRDPQVMSAAEFYGKLGKVVNKIHDYSEDILAGDLNTALPAQGAAMDVDSADIAAYLTPQTSTNVVKGSAMGSGANMNSNVIPKINEWGNDDAIGVTHMEAFGDQNVMSYPDVRISQVPLKL